MITSMSMRKSRLHLHKRPEHPQKDLTWSLLRTLIPSSKIIRQEQLQLGQLMLSPSTKALLVPQSVPAVEHIRHPTAPMRHHTVPVLDRTQSQVLHPTPVLNRMARKVTHHRVRVGRIISGLEIPRPIRKNLIHVSRLPLFSFFLTLCRLQSTRGVAIQMGQGTIIS
jgi:hypothetical protein